jgi:hypothetical protein
MAETRHKPTYPGSRAAALFFPLAGKMEIAFSHSLRRRLLDNP